MIPFVTIGARDRAQSAAFYDATLGALGYERTRDDERWIAYGPKGTGAREVFVGAPFAGEAQGGNGIMVAFHTPHEAAVRAAHAAGLAGGGTDEGTPGYRPEDSGWYGAYLRDPAGNKICICVND
jgi:catechol 2,3-dioxygenase-like lactoylglutathione lyase family enzyme